jgi:hypothetical protein
MSVEKDAPNRPAGFTSVLHIPRRRATDYETVPPRCLLFGRSAPRAECSECSRTRPRIDNPNQTAFDATMVMAICIPACLAAPPKTIISIAARVTVTRPFSATTTTGMHGGHLTSLLGAVAGKPRDPAETCTRKRSAGSSTPIASSSTNQRAMTCFQSGR